MINKQTCKSFKWNQILKYEAASPVSLPVLDATASYQIVLPSALLRSSLALPWEVQAASLPTAWTQPTLGHILISHNCRVLDEKVSYIRNFNFSNCNQIKTHTHSYTHTHIRTYTHTHTCTERKRKRTQNEQPHAEIIRKHPTHRIIKTLWRDIK